MSGFRFRHKENCFTFLNNEIEVNVQRGSEDDSIKKLFKCHAKEDKLEIWASNRAKMRKLKKIPLSFFY